MLPWWSVGEEWKEGSGNSSSETRSTRLFLYFVSFGSLSLYLSPSPCIVASSPFLPFSHSR